MEIHSPFHLIECYSNVGVYCSFCSNDIHNKFHLQLNNHYCHTISIFCVPSIHIDQSTIFGNISLSTHILRFDYISMDFHVLNCNFKQVFYLNIFFFAEKSFGPSTRNSSKLAIIRNDLQFILAQKNSCWVIQSNNNIGAVKLVNISLNCLRNDFTVLTMRSRNNGRPASLRPINLQR